MSNITAQIEDSLLTKLAALKVEQPNGYVRTLRAYAGDYRAARKEITLLMPAVLIAYPGARYRRLGGGAYEVTCEWRIVVADNNQRSETARRRGGTPATSAPGTFKMLDDIKALLDGEVLLSGTRPFELLREELIEGLRNISLYAQLWRTCYLEFNE